MKILILKRLKPLFLLLAINSLLNSTLAEELNNLESFDPQDKSQRVKQLKIKSLSDLQQLTPYQSVSVIQKRYLPKTFRGEFNVSLSSMINHTYFYLLGASLRAGFFIREDHGFGLEGFFFINPIDKVVTKDLINAPNNIIPINPFFSQFYGGLYYKWSPVFGKFSVLNKKIVYFDTYMIIGGGASRFLTALSQERRSVLGDTVKINELSQQISPTFTLGIGQMFALSQSWALNWDLKWFLSILQVKDVGSSTSSNISLSFGGNFYFPGARYR